MDQAIIVGLACRAGNLNLGRGIAGRVGGFREPTLRPESGADEEHMRTISLAGLTAALALVAAGAPGAGAQPEPELVARARAIHDRVITLDTHDDINPAHFTASCNYTMRLSTQVDLPKMREGGLDVAFFIVYVGQPNPGQVQDAFRPSGYDRAYRAAIEKFDAIHRLTTSIAPDQIELALSPDDVLRIAKSGKKVAVIGIENGYPMGTDLGRIQEFHARGGRYMSMAHNGHSQLADSHTGEASNQWAFGGLSPLGRQAVEAMNRLGIMIDVSHTSKGATMQTIGLSKAPVIASHSSVRTLANHSRNLDDETLMAVKHNGGVVQIVAFAGYVKIDPPERTAALAELRRDFGQQPPQASQPAQGSRPAPGCPRQETAAADQGAGPPAPGVNRAALSPERRADFERRLADIDRRWPSRGPAAVADVVDHIDYAVKLMGLDHVGISSDFDGGGGVEGWNSAAETFNVTLELVRRGYTEEQIGKIWSGNLLRVWRESERVARELRAATR
jgi:membrane dipeptidase